VNSMARVCALREVDADLLADQVVEQRGLAYVGRPTMAMSRCEWFLQTFCLAVNRGVRFAVLSWRLSYGASGNCRQAWPEPPAVGIAAGCCPRRGRLSRAMGWRIQPGTIVREPRPCVSTTGVNWQRDMLAFADVPAAGSLHPCPASAHPLFPDKARTGSIHLFGCGKTAIHEYRAKQCFHGIRQMDGRRSRRFLRSPSPNLK